MANSTTIRLNNRSADFQEFLYRQTQAVRADLIAKEKRCAASHSSYLASCEETYKDALHGYQETPAGRSGPMFSNSALRWFSEEHQPHLVYSPEAALWRAVVEQALMDVESGSPTAKAWIASDDYRVGSLDWICLEVGIDIGAVRRVARNREPCEVAA